MELSAEGAELTEYHVEAGIAAVQATLPTMHATDWQEIVSLYDTLMTIRPTPNVVLNRAIGVGQRGGAVCGLREMRTISDSDRLAKYPFYHAAFAEFELQIGHTENAIGHFEIAHETPWNESSSRIGLSVADNMRASQIRSEKIRL